MMTSKTSNRPARIRMTFGALLLAFSTAASACTPAEIEGTFGLLEQSFEQAGLEGAVSTGLGIAPEVAMRVGMRLGSLGS